MRKKNAAAVALGRRGGRVTSVAKSAAARANGAKGGRPRRVVDAPAAPDTTWQAVCDALGMTKA